MGKAEQASVARYLGKQPRHAQAALRRVRRLILDSVPGLEEGISYQIPVYKLEGELVIFFAGWSTHYALYPALEVAKAFEKELLPYEVSKGTIRFPLDDVPAKLITRIVKFRAKVAKARLAAKRAKPTGKSPATRKAPSRRR